MRKNNLIIFSLMVFAVWFGMISCTHSRPHYNIGINTYLVPFSYRTAEDQVGIDLDILKAISEEMNFTYTLTEVTFSDFIDRLQDNSLDGVMAAVTITEDRKQYLDYSIPYFGTGIEIITHEKNNSVNRLSDIKGCSVAVLEGSTMSDYIEKNAQMLGVGKIIHLKTSDLINKYLIEGRADIAVSEIPIVRYLMNQGFPFKSVYSFAESDYAFAVRKNTHRKLLEDYNIGFAKIVSNGKFQQILDKYYE